MGGKCVDVVRQSGEELIECCSHDTNTILSWKVNIWEVLHMFVHTSEDFLQGVPKFLVHNVIIHFAHGGDIAR